MEEKYVMMCPKCGSTSFKTDFAYPIEWEYEGARANYICNSCGYTAEIFLEVIESEVQKIREKIRRGEI